ncbi:65-kDa microtubule-associated protein 3-like [Rhododendron vialii]|uniref:65-kDa microtubule-associated protein 3-like n=1 Tax=Rhododendron vialii TaxID=182163 RepID=UPI00265E869D|nr:65-kDa microtubule-associated protein 3-like [Rhododendron vialii]XP_058205731.1 65-kDa microtubule-associated protein 3-like [Rhododendron vialii]
MSGRKDPLLQGETTCGPLLYELQAIWDEVGESETERNKMLLDIEQECLEVYKRMVDQANRCRAQLRQAIADYQAEIAAIYSAMGERQVQIRQSDHNPCSLKEEHTAIILQLEEMQKRKCDRRNQVREVLEQIQQISSEMQCLSRYTLASTVVDETDLSLRKLEELQGELQALQKEKSDRLKHVLDLLNTLKSLCSVLGIDFKQTANEVHPSLGNDCEGPKNPSKDFIVQLGTAIQQLREVKIKRMQQLQDLATSLLELWNLMDTPTEEQQKFQNVTCNIAASEQEITDPNTLSVDSIDSVEAEVSRLEELKASKMKELVSRKRLELEEICQKMHLIPESNSAVEIAIEAVESGELDPACVLEQIELQIGKAKEEAYSRIEILDKIEKWLAAREEECWLEEYNMDDNRYNAGRGTHLNLKRAEKARSLVNKLPGMAEALASKTTLWENERGVEFTYDGIRLLSMIEEYTSSRQEKEQERKRQREQRRLQGQTMAEQEVLFGSKPSLLKIQSGKRSPRLSSGGGSNRGHSAAGTMPQTPKDDSLPSIKVNAHEVESPMKRRPFSPISSKEPSKSNTTTNLAEDFSKK